MNQLDIFTGQDKTELAIDFLKLHEPPEGYFVGFSGGKDSVVMLDLVRKSGVKHAAYYSATQIDPPELVSFIHRHYPEVKWLFPKESFFKLIAKKGYPSRYRRWCCDHLKEKPTRQIPLNNRLLGIRAEESSKRAARGQISKMGKWTQYKPIFQLREGRNQGGRGMSEKQLYLSPSQVKEFSFRDGKWFILYDIPDPEPTEAEVKAEEIRKLRDDYDNLFADMLKENEALRDCIRELIRVQPGGYCPQGCEKEASCPYPDMATCPQEMAWAKARELVGA